MIKNTPQKQEFIPFAGGLDIVSPFATMKPGFVRDSLNVEQDINAGYASITGYERYDGRSSPSDAIYYSLTYTVAGTVAVGDTITGATSAATGKVIAINTDNSEFIITKVTGTWAAENTTAGGATVTGPQSSGSYSGLLNAIYNNLAADAYRADITEVGSGVCTGSVLGVWYYLGVVYAFRNLSAGGVGMFKSTASGWSQVSLNYEISFTNANTSVNDGDTLTQGGVTASILRVVVETGTLLSGTNTGRLIIGTPSGGNFAAGAATSDGGGSLTLDAAQTAITISTQGGRFSFVNAAFSGVATSQRMYGADGSNRVFEFDGTVFVPIYIGGLTPKYVNFHQNHLFVGVQSSIMHSAIGDPYNWTTTAGAGEIALSDTVTGMMPQVGDANSATLIVYCRNRTYTLYGTSSADWNNVLFSNMNGGIPYSMQKVGHVYVLDDRGISTLKATQEFGNFAQSTISKLVKPWLTARRATLTDSCIARDKGQFRLFFADGSGLYCTVDSEYPAMMPVLFPNAVNCVVSDETYGGGEEVAFFGSSNGYVYQLDRGTSFDGAAIEWFADLAFNHSKLFRGLKKYRRITLEAYGSGYSVVNMAYSLSYGDGDTIQPDTTNLTIQLNPSFWDTATWDVFYWDGTNITPISMATPGHGENISIHLGGNSDYDSVMRFSGALLEYSPLRMLR